MTQFKRNFDKLTKNVEQKLVCKESYFNRAEFLFTYFNHHEFDSIKSQNRYHEMMEADLGEAIRLDPKYVNAYLLRGKIIGNAGDEDGAYDDLKKVITIEPDHIQGNFEMAFVLFKKEKFEEAMIFFDKTIELKPDYGEAYHYRAHMAGLMDRDQQMENDYETAIKLLGETAELYSSRGSLYTIKGYLDKALRDFDRAIELEPLNAEHYINKAKVHEMLGDEELSYDILIEISEKDTSNINEVFCAGLYTNRGVIRIANEDNDRALDDFNKALEYSPDMVAVLYNRAMVHTMKKDLDKALKDYEEVIIIEEKLDISIHSQNAKRGILELHKQMDVKISRWKRFKNWLSV